MGADKDVPIEKEPADVQPDSLADQALEAIIRSRELRRRARKLRDAAQSQGAAKETDSKQTGKPL